MCDHQEHDVCDECLAALEAWWAERNAELDARHDYAGVSDDLAIWWGKVRYCGIIGGHDFIDKTTPDTDFGVKSAVLNFLTSVGHETVYQTDDTRQHTSWLAYKGGLA